MCVCVFVCELCFVFTLKKLIKSSTKGDERLRERERERERERRKRRRMKT